jgi:hypothetical protein
MTVDLDGRVIRGIVLGSTLFRNKWADLPGVVQDESIAVIQSLVGMNIDHIPRKLHLHQLVNKEVASFLDPKKRVNAWSLHITADDRYKASFTYENGTLYFRTCGVHQVVDKLP